MKKINVSIILSLLLFISCCSESDKKEMILSEEKICELKKIAFKRFSERSGTVRNEDVYKYNFDITVFDNDKIQVYIFFKEKILGGDCKIIYDSNLNIIFEQYAEQLMNERYGKGNWKLPNKEYNKLKKWGDRGFE